MTRSTQGMSWLLRLLISFVVGVILYQLVARELLKLLPGMPSAIASQMVQALVVSVVIAVAVLLAAKLLGRTSKTVVLSGLLLGMLACFAYWIFADVAAVAVDPKVEPISADTVLKEYILVPWFKVPMLLAPWLGFVLGAWRAPRAPRARSGLAEA
jgi:hypothetical protein